MMMTMKMLLRAGQGMADGKRQLLDSRHGFRNYKGDRYTKKTPLFKALNITDYHISYLPWLENTQISYSATALI